jgi:hypothetical protein
MWRQTVADAGGAFYKRGEWLQVFDGVSARAAALPTLLARANLLATLSEPADRLGPDGRHLQTHRGALCRHGGAGVGA